MRSNIFESEEKSVEYNWNYLKSIGDIALIKADIRDVGTLERVFAEFRPDIVIHAAGQPGVRMSIENPIEDYSINSTGTLNVLEALRKTNELGIFIYCSTNKVYGANIESYELIEESARYRYCEINGVKETESIDQTGHTPYGVSKLVGELYAQDYSYTYGMRTGIFRMSCIYGTRQFGFEDQGWIAWFCRRFVTGEPITLYGNGKQVRDVLWVTDLVSAFDYFIKSGHQHNVFNIGGGPENTLSLLELISILEDRTGRTVEVRSSKWRNHDQKVYISDIGKVSEKFGWSPVISPKEGIGMLMRWIESNSFLFSSTD
jgi:CDP-paratose 2-epimerase